MRARYDAGDPFAVDDVTGAVLPCLQFHAPELSVAAVQVEYAPDERSGRHGAEADTYSLVDADHVHHYEQQEEGDQSPGEKDEVLRAEPAKFRRLADPFIDIILHRYSIPPKKNDLRTVAATIRKTQLPNQLAAVLPVSGSPELNLL